VAGGTLYLPYPRVFSILIFNYFFCKIILNDIFFLSHRVSLMLCFFFTHTPIPYPPNELTMKKQHPRFYPRVLPLVSAILCYHLVQIVSIVVPLTLHLGKVNPNAN
jgi:hypothetical protein